ncbi:MAG: cytochrome c [Bacteroidia bacterium]
MKLIVRIFFAVACTIIILACNSEEKKDNSNIESIFPTWEKDIARIIFKNCTPCHRPSQSGPFSLLSYHDAVKQAAKIKFVTKTKYMPPWPADPNYTHFVGERTLSEREINLIVKWVENKMPRGDTLNEPKPPVYNDLSFYGKPDLVIKPQEVVKIKGNGTDVFLIMKYPYEIPNDTIADLIEFVPHQRKIVHHVNGHLIGYDENRKFNYMTGESIHFETQTDVMNVYESMHIPYTDGMEPKFPMLTPDAVYYLPGYEPPHYPKEIGGYRLKKNGAFLLNNIHYGPSNMDLIDSSYINVFFRKEPIQRPIKETQLGTFGISKIEPEFVIPPNEVKTFHTYATIDKPISMLSVNPHMHLIGKSFWAFALKPNGDTIPLIKIPKWDFRWQYYYTFLNPVKIESGSVIHVYGTYDNTKENPFNPYYPPQTITQGNGVESMKTTEEMFQFIFTFVPYKDGDEKIILKNSKNNQ